MKRTAQILIHLLLAAPLHSNELQPPNWMEQVEAQDSSIHECYVFRSSPGVRYRIETSNDFADWSPQEEIYGLGHEHVVPITPVRSVSLKIQPATGENGGTIVSWRSLDDDSPVILLLPQAMTADWNRMPLFWERYGNHYFFIFRSPQSIPPPSTVAVLGPLDQLMYSQLQTSFPIINQTIENSVAKARNSPPPAPSDPSARKFWRIFCDWSLDTDFDGSPDWVEFEIAARESGNPALRGDAFDGDTNQNGIADGKELDYDEDGIADANDIDLKDSSAAFPIGPVPRYALFPISNAQGTETPPTGQVQALQISDKGTVLYQNGTWTAGTWTALTASGNGLSHATARAINDRNVILGFGSPTGANINFSQICYWSNSDGNTLPVPVGTSGTAALLATNASDSANGPGEGFVANLLSPGPLLANDGTFFMGSSTWNHEENRYDFAGYGKWRLPTAGQSAISREEGGRGLRYAGEDGLFWGMRPVAEDPYRFDGGIIHAGQTTLETNFMPTNVHVLPNGRILAIPPFASNSALVYSNGAWTTGTLYSRAIDLSSNGTAIGQSHDNLNAPILINGNWQDIHQTSPGLPDHWKSPGVKLLDTTPGGWILAQRDATDTTPSLEDAVMLPLFLRQHPEGDLGATQLNGLDNQSVGATVSRPSVKDSLWLMAPIGGGETLCTLKAPLNAATPLKLSGDHLKFNGDAETILSETENPLSLSVATDNPPISGSEGAIKLHFGETEAVSTPIKVKFMKARTVKINLYHVPLGTDAPDFALTHTEVQAFLTSMFKSKINVEFTVQPVVTLPGGWDADGDGAMDALPEDEIHAEQKAVRDSRPESPPESNIDLFLMSGQRFNVNGSSSGPLPAWGVTNRALRCCWIHAETLAVPENPNQGRTEGDFGITLVHEIAHIFTDYGHPDEDDGVSPLPGTDRTLRLMHSGENSRGGRLGTVLVKEEWDEAEKWLKQFVDSPTQ